MHFSMHGNPSGPTLEGDDGRAEGVDPEGLANLIQNTDSVECVVLNACYAETYAPKLSAHVKFVVAMGQEVKDSSAIDFSKGFYEALLIHNKNYKDAFSLGVARTSLSEPLDATLYVDGIRS